MSDSYLYLLPIWIQILQLSLSKKKNTKYKITSSKKYKKSNTISRTKGKKENRYSHHPFVFKCLIPICICYLFEFKYFNSLYKKKNAKCKITSSKKIKRVILSHIQKGKKKTIILTTHLYSNILFISVFVIYLYLNTSIIFIKKYKITSSKKKNHYFM